MKMYFVRHTEYHNPENIYAFHLPFYLSEKGRVDARKIGKWFTEQSLGALPIVASPIVRAVQTAELIASETGSNVEVDVRLSESSCTDLEGKVKPAEKHWIEEEDNPTREKQESLRDRMVSIYKDVVTSDHDTILVSHGDPLTVLYYYLKKESPPRYFWDPVNEDKVVQRGEILIVDVQDGEVASIERKHL